jgi:hypothetical protein
MMKYEAFAKHIALIEKIALDSDRVLLKDNKCNRIIEVLLTNGELQCLLDESSHCIHVAFCIFAARVIFYNQIQGSRSPKSVHIDLHINLEIYITLMVCHRYYIVGQSCRTCSWLHFRSVNKMMVSRRYVL